MQKDQTRELFPLSYSQQNIWNLEQAYPGISINNICTALYIEGNFRVDLLQECIACAYEVFPVLRTRVTREDGRILQYISDEMPFPAPFIDFSKTNQSGGEIWNHSAAREHLPLFNKNLCQMTIFKLSENKGGIMTRVHHIIADAWSQALVTNHIIHNYFQLLQSKEPERSLSPDYRLHIEMEQKYMASRNFERDKEFWRAVLKDFPVTQLKEHRYANVSPIGVRHSIRLSSRMNRMIAAFCEQKRVSPFAVFYMGIAIYMCRMKNQKRFCIGVPTINRLNYREKQSAGMFVNTLPFVNEIDDNMTFHEWNDKLKDDWFSLLYHQRIPFEEIKKILAAENNMLPEQLFGIALSYQNGKIDHLRGAKVTVEGRWIYSGYQAEALCVHVSSRDAQNQFLIDYDYLAQLFSEDDIEQFHKHLMQILKHALQNPDMPVKDLEIIGEDEEEKLIFNFNKAQRWYQREHSLKQALMETALEYPERAALIWEGRRLTYMELLERGEEDAGRIRTLVQGEENVVAILLERQEELFQLMVSAACSGNAWLLLDTSLPEGRIRMMLEESDAVLCISSEGHIEKVSDVVCRKMTLQEFREVRPSAENTLDAGPHSLAYLVYTSGSTGRPKAVAVEQRSVLNLAVNMADIYPKGAVLSLCNIGFDAFILESMAAFLNGRTVVAVREEDVNDSRKLADYITGYDVGFAALTPSRLGAYLKGREFQSAVRKLECIICGGENLPGELLQELRRYSGAKLYNQYGPSEATVAVSHTLVTGDRRLTIGKPFANCRIYILDENQKALPAGCAGELYIGGDCLARGYYKDEALTRERFVSDPFIPGERLYRTGDLGEWTEDGEIIFLGRKDRQVKLLGHRIEPGEVEDRLLACPGVQRAAVTVYKNQLIAYYTAGKQIEPEELLAFAADYLPRYMLPVYAKQLEEIPETNGGKTDYRGLPEPELMDDREEPADETERKILAVWKKVLGKEEIGIHSDYFLSGGDSLNAAVMMAELEKTFGHLLKLEEIYRNSTVRKLASLMHGENAPVSREYIKKAPKLAGYPLSAAQQSFYVLEQSDETKRSYHMAGAFEAQGIIDREKLARAFEKLVAEEELFRTGFDIHENQVAARIYDETAFTLEEAKGKSLKEALANLARPFDLAKPPLMRAALFKDYEKEKQYLLLDIHHIISDGMSSVLTMKRLDAYYRGMTPALPQFTYKDYAWSSRQDGGIKEEEKVFWEGLVKEGIPELGLPLDYTRPPVFDGKGSRLYFELSAETEGKLIDFSQNKKLTTFTILFSAYALLLFGLSGQNRFAVGSPLMGRRHSEFQEMLGAFVNTLPIPVNVDKEESTEDFLTKMQTQITAVIDHQEAAFEEIVEMAGVRHTREKNPLFTTLFSLAPLNPDEFALGDVKLKFVPGDTHAVKVDLHLEAAPKEDGYRFCLEYAQSLFDAVTIEYYSRCYRQILEELLGKPQQCVNEIQMVSAGDWMRLIEQPACMRTPYEQICIDQMINRYGVWKQKEAAVCWGDGEVLSYEEINQQSDVLAERLRETGVGHGDVAAFMPRRNGTMLTVMLGILKAGAAYLPVDAAFPRERVDYMLETAGAVCLITGEGILCSTEVCPVYSVEALRDSGEKAWQSEAKLPVIPAQKRSPEDAANVIFTSGSTGRPKGVVMVHKALANLACHDGPVLGGEDDCILCASNCVFDVFTTETLLALAAGRRISVADEEEMLLPWKMAGRIQRDGVTILQLTPSRMLMCLNEESFCQALLQIRIIILMGEPWTMQLKERLKKLTRAKIYNIYGPTETSVYNCQGEIRNCDAIHIGKPIGNCRYYLLDEKRRPVMPTARGEIYIAGECLARGYINRKDLTDEVFVEDPFFPGEVMYKTGDVGRLRADGNWQCLGRVDNQLKLNGHRIEPQEIAQQIVESGQCSEAAVLPVKKDGVVQHLRACFVPRTGYQKAELMNWLALRLPDYMIPSEFVTLEKMPKTASGKIDFHALQELGPEEEEAAEVQASEQTEVSMSEGSRVPEKAFIYNIWREVLNTEPRDTVSFFEQGGTSLKAIIVLNHYYKYHYELSLNDFYRYPTLKEQLTLLGCEEPAKEEADENEEMPDAREEITPYSSPIEIKEKTVFLTGATGYLGAHLLRELLQKGVKKVICLLRNVSDIRLRETLNIYFGSEFYLNNWGRIETICGDVSTPGLGLSESVYKKMAAKTDVVIHSAADVRHFAPEDELLRMNVDGTAEMLAFAKEGGCAFVHMSTVSVAGEYLSRAPEAKAVFTESCLDIGQNWQENGYAKTKMLAEKLVFDAAENGLEVKVFRIGRLVQRQRDGVFQKNPRSNAYYRLIRGLAEFGRYPESLNVLSFEMTPVDEAAEAVVRLLGSERKCLHIVNTRQYTLGEVLQTLCGIPPVDDGVFDTMIRQAVLKEDDAPSEYVRSAAEMWVSRTALLSNITVDASVTVKELEHTGFRWKLPDVEVWMQAAGRK